MKHYLVFLAIASVLGCSSTVNMAPLDLGYGDYTHINPLFTLSDVSSAVRKSETILSVYSPSKATYLKREAITIFDKEDKDLARVVLFYDNFRDIDYLKANVVDGNGRIVHSYVLDDAIDFSVSGVVSFYTDSRVKVLELLHNSFPYTIEYEYKVTYSGLLNLPDWYPLEFNQGLESASLVINDYGNTGIRFLTMNFDLEADVEDTPQGKRYKWSMGLKMPIKREPYGPGGDELLPHVLVSPGQFEMEESYGNSQTWESFGQWYYKLGTDTRVLSEGAKAEIDELISGVEDESEKVRILYKHMQDKNRYVSIQLGIGGWKPFSADYVYTNSYGDCKALTNYMQTILEYAGIHSNSVLIRSGGPGDGLVEEFPGNQFNHVILRVNLNNGEHIWLENTNKYLPAGDLGSNHGKLALLISEEGGEVVRTPEKDYTENLNNDYYEFSISEDGEATVKNVNYLKGYMRDQILSRFMPISEAERLEYIGEMYSIDHNAINQHDFSGLDADGDYDMYSFEASLTNFVTTSRKRLYVPVNKFKGWVVTFPDSDDERTQSVELKYEFTHDDSTLFKLPEGYSVELMPKAKSINTDFAEYEMGVRSTENGNLMIKRMLKIKETDYSAEQYDALKGFFDDVKSADGQKIVLVKEE